MGCLNNYDVAHLNILYFYNFSCQSPRISTLENLGPSLLYHSFVFQVLGVLYQKN